MGPARPLGALGPPVWIALAVLDPEASHGRRHLPDTHVVRF